MVQDSSITTCEAAYSPKVGRRAKAVDLSITKIMLKIVELRPLICRVLSPPHHGMGVFIKKLFGCPGLIDARSHGVTPDLV